MLENEAKKPKERTLTVTNQIQLDPKNPIPIQYGGESFSIVRGKKYIPFLGRDNNLPNLLLEARLTSTTQDNCISSIARSVTGNGLSFLDEHQKSLDITKVEPELITWMKCVNNENDTFDDILLEAVDGEREQGNQFLEIVKGIVGGKPFLKIYLHPFQNCRFTELDKNEIVPSAVTITKMFAKRGYRYNLDNARVVPMWSPNPLDQKKCWLKDSDGHLRTMLHFKNTRKGVDYYGMPASISNLRYQVIEGLLAQYNIDNLENNMILGGMLMFKSAMTEQEAIANAERILLSHLGAGKTGRVAVLSSESGLEDVKFEKYDTKGEGSFMEFDKRIERKIIASNDWHPLLAGIDESAHLGAGSNFIRSVWELKEASLLNPLRRKLVDKLVIPLMKIYADVFAKEEVLKYNYWFNSAMPYSFLSDVKPEQFLQINEMRSLAGYGPDSKMDGKYLSDLKTTPAANNNNNATQ